MAVKPAWLYEIGSDLSPDDEAALYAVAETLGKRRNSSPQATHEYTQEFLRILHTWRAPARLLFAALLLPFVATDPTIVREVKPLVGEETLRLTRHASELLQMGMREPWLQEATDNPLPRAARLAEFFQATYTDNYEITLLCIAAHWAYARELDTLDRDRQRCWAELADAIIIPLLELLGMWSLRQDVAQAIFPYLASSRQQRSFRDAVKTYDERYTPLFTLLEKQLSTIFATGRVSAKYSLRPLTAGGLFQRQREAQRRGEEFRLTEALSVIRVNVITNDGDEAHPHCYDALGLVHRLGQPAGAQGGAARIRDAIARPQRNGYRSLLTTITWEDPRDPGRQHLIELYIRSKEMDSINRDGIVAARLHKRRQPAPGAWWEDTTLLMTLRMRQHAGVSGVPVADNRVYVFSPAGAIHWLPAGSVALDYAFRVHSALGVYARRFHLNGIASAPDERLRDGMLAEVEFDRNQSSATHDWEEIVTTASARRQIRRWLKSQRDAPSHSQLRHQSPADKVRAQIGGKLAEELNLCELRLTPEEIERSLAQVARQLGYGAQKAMYQAVKEGELEPDQIIAWIVEAQLVGYILRKDGQPWPKDRIRIARCWQNASFRRKQGKGASKRPPKEDRVYPGASIVGYEVGAGPQRRLIVHRQGCELIPHDVTLISLEWQATGETREAIEVTINAWDRPLLLDDILKVIYRFYGQAREAVYLHRFNAEVLQDNSVRLEFVVDAPTIAELQPLRVELDNLQSNGVIRQFDIWRYRPGQRVLLTDLTRSERANPYTLHDVKNPSMFFGRETELDELLVEVRKGDSLVAIVGQTRIGKTSLLTQFQQLVMRVESNVVPIFFDLQGHTQSTSAILLGLAEATLVHLRRFTEGSHLHLHQLRLQEKHLREEPFLTFRHWLEEVQAMMHGRRLLFLIDEFTLVDDAWRDGRLPADFFTGMRHLISAREHAQFVLAVHDTLYRRPTGAEGRKATGGAVSLLREARIIPLGQLDDDAAKNMVRQPLADLYAYDEEVISAILAISGNRPFFLQLLCLELTSRMARSGRTQVTRADLDAVVGKLLVGEVARGYLSHLHVELRQTQDEQLVLNALARAAGETNRWVDEEEIQRTALILAAQRGLRQFHSYDVPPTIEWLTQCGLIERRQATGGYRARIPVGLYHHWLRSGYTSPSVLQGQEPD